MIGPVLFVRPRREGAAPQAPVAEPLPAPTTQAPPAAAAVTTPASPTIQVVAGVYNLGQFQSELRRAVALIDMGSESDGLESLDKLAALSSEVRRVRNLRDDERADHSPLFVERAKGYLSAG